MNNHTFAIRDVTEADLSALTAFDEECWGRLRITPLTRDELAGWLATGSPFFFLAEFEGRIIGYFYGQCNDFSPARADEYTSIDILSRKGYILKPHDPDGDSLCGITISSVMRGAGSALTKELHKRLRSSEKRYYFGFSRMSGFRTFAESLTDQQRIHAEEEGSHALALWYAHECMSLIQGKIWRPWCTPKPNLSLPFPNSPDRTLSFNVKGMEGLFGLLRVVPDFMPDPESMDYAALCACDLTEL